MEPILDAGKAVVCMNIIRQENPCINLYCHNCCVNFSVEKYNFEDHSKIKESNLESAEAKIKAG